jgi:hypothetical protein
MVNPEVTQANIKQTICTKDFATSLRARYAPESYTEDLKTLQIAEYGYTDKKPPTMRRIISSVSRSAAILMTREISA